MSCDVFDDRVHVRKFTFVFGYRLKNFTHQHDGARREPCESGVRSKLPRVLLMGGVRVFMFGFVQTSNRGQGPLRVVVRVRERKLAVFAKHHVAVVREHDNLRTRRIIESNSVLQQNLIRYLSILTKNCKPEAKSKG